MPLYIGNLLLPRNNLSPPFIWATRMFHDVGRGASGIHRAMEGEM